ncbi:MAG: response regulator [Gemmatimonadales bacterium]|nr:MAG: response regulator [Gemmatimonadales bacterium]
MRILVAEDEGVSRVVLSTKLKEMGHEVIEARDGSEAWSRYQEELPRIIITDWMMPGMDGGDLCQRVRAQVDRPYTYIVVLTSLSGKGRYLEAMDAGADDFLTKPVDMDELTARLRVAERVLALQTEVQLMQRLLPICMDCKKIRDKDASWEDQSSWQELEAFVAERGDVQFSHGICKECYEKRFESELDS